MNDKNRNHYTRRQIEWSMGTDIKIVSELLGHSDVSFTYNVYIGIFDRDKHDAVMKLNQI